MSLKWLLLFWGVVVTLAFIFGGKEGGMVAAAIASISSVIMLFQSASAWEGTVVDVYSRETTERIDNLEDDRPYTRTVIRDYAKLELRSGGVKEGEYKKGYWDIQIGDHLKKERGKTGWELIKAK